MVAERLSKFPSGYSHDVFQAIAAKQLEKAGFEVHGGQTIQYLVVNSKSGRVNERVLAAQLTKPYTRHDVEEYLKMLISAAETLLESSDTTKNKIHAQVLHHEKQTMLR